MGFLRRIFSIGGKKQKKQRPQIVHNVDSHLRVIDEEEHEAAIGRLLRSSSARYKVVSEADYNSLPPLPHPINEVIPPPSSSGLSIASTTVSQRGSYTVTVHGRKRDALTEFPDANRDHGGDEHDDDLMPRHPRSSLAPKESSHLFGLRSDPSVVSLLEMYDDRGQIASDAFSNSPPRKSEGRPQTKRNGSTLRQLLGNPPESGSKGVNDSALGDISWAERFLGENTSGSSASSFDIRTPVTPDDPFHHDTAHIIAPRDISLSTNHDLSMYDNPAISSMEVELSAGSLLSVNGSFDNNGPYRTSDPTTPQRASQVFEFLTAKRRASKFSMDLADKTFPDPPSRFSMSDMGSPEQRSHFSDDSVDVNPPSRIPRPRFEDFTSLSIDPSITPRASRVPTSETFCPVLPAAVVRSRPKSTEEQTSGQETANEVKVIMTGPTTVIVTAPTPSYKQGASRLPRGPRMQSQRRSSGSKPRRSMLVERSNSTPSQPYDFYTAIPKRHSQRPSSRGSSSSTSGRVDIGQPTVLAKTSHRKSTEPRTILAEMNKENGSGISLSVTHKLPSTPLRSKSDSKSLFRTVVNPGTFEPPAGKTPSPASSSDLSPVGRQLMMNIREQRSRARDVDRTKYGGRSSRR